MMYLYKYVYLNIHINAYIYTHLNKYQVEAVMDRIKDNISLDHLSRLLVEVQTDSSAIVDAIISQNQVHTWIHTYMRICI
jgi:hypothetical protein